MEEITDSSLEEMAEMLIKPRKRESSRLIYSTRRGIIGKNFRRILDYSRTYFHHKQPISLLNRNNNYFIFN